MKYTSIFFIALMLASCSKKDAQPVQTPVQTPQKITYKDNIEGIIKKYCYTCHSPDRTYNYSNAGDLNTYTELVKRVENGSLKDRVLVKKNMPLAGFPTLTSEETKQLQDWLDNQYPLE